MSARAELVTVRSEIEERAGGITRAAPGVLVVGRGIVVTQHKPSISGKECVDPSEDVRERVLSQDSRAGPGVAQTVRSQCLAESVDLCLSDKTVWRSDVGPRRGRVLLLPLWVYEKEKTI